MELRPMTTEDLELVLEWRNRPEIRKNMYTSHVISKDEHYSWFSRVSKDPSKRFLMATIDSAAVGHVNFVDIDLKSRKASWAFYSGDTTTRGLGTQMEYCALNYAFEELNLEKLNCEVLSFNQAVVRLHRKFGFDVEGIFRGEHFDGEARHDVYRLAMHRKVWLDYQRPLFRSLICNESEARPKWWVGDKHKETVSITAEIIEAFASASGDRNPIHFDDIAARNAGFDRRVSHGAILVSLFSKVLGTNFPGSGTVLVSQSCRYVAPVYLGQEVELLLTVVGRVGRRIWISTEARSDDDTLVFSGEVEVLIPKKEAQA